MQLARSQSRSIKLGRIYTLERRMVILMRKVVENSRREQLTGSPQAKLMRMLACPEFA